MKNSLVCRAGLVALALVAFSPVSQGAAYTVFNWNGRTAPAKPTGPPFLPAATTTVYSGAQYFETATNSFQPLSVTFRVIPVVFPTASSNPTSWTVDNAGTGFTYGYQSPDEAEWRLGTASAEVQLRITMDFSHSVFNPSFMLMDIDNATSDEITQIVAYTNTGGMFTPSVSLVAGSVVRITGAGTNLMLDSTGGNSTDTQALGSAFLEWSMGGVTHLEFTWKGKSGTSIRMANLYAEFDPAGFTQVAAEAAVPEPGTIVMFGLGLGAIVLGRWKLLRR